MYLCYMDESGTSAIPGTTSHFVLVGLSVPIWHWRDCDREIKQIKKAYDIEDAEIHTAWIARKYLEQRKITCFEGHGYVQRIAEVNKYRKRELLRLLKQQASRTYRQMKKNYAHTEPYIHLSYGERRQLLLDLAKCVSNWGFARLFGECIDKIYFDPLKSAQTVDEQAFEQVVSRFEQYLAVTSSESQRNYGLLIHDNNETVSKKHTELMCHFHKKGTLWTKVQNIIETPLFVDSRLTSMVQIADLCSYSIRRYLENGEDELFNLIFSRADRRYGLTVGVRHFTEKDCMCAICASHTR